jgi:hypothetical protein
VLIVDKDSRLIAILGGRPEHENWQKGQDEAQEKVAPTAAANFLRLAARCHTTGARLSQ